MLGVLFFAGYYFLAFRPLTTSPASGRSLTLPFITMPPLQVLDAFAFAALGTMSLLFMVGLTTYRGGHKQADIDVLFPTPISPKVVMAFRMIRDSLLSLILPLLFVIIAWRPASGTWTSLIAGVDPGAAAHSLRLLTVAYLLMALGWVSLGYAVSLWVHRPGPALDARIRWVNVGIAGLLLAIVGMVAWSISRDPSAENMIAVTQHAWLRGFLFLPTLAVSLVLAPVRGDLLGGLLGAGGLVGFAAVCFWLALRQSRWLYETAAQRVSTTVQTATFTRKGDTYGVAAEMVRSGKAKAARILWLSRLKLMGPKALVWKDLLSAYRSIRLLLVLFPLIGALAMALIFTAGSSASDPHRGTTVFFTIMIAMMSVASASLPAQSGFVDMLQRVDTLKPLPFTAAKTMFYEVIGKAIGGIIAAICLSLFGAALWPSIAVHCFGAGIASAAASVLVTSCTGLTTVLFPDVEDPTQRGFRGLVQSLTLLVTALPPAAMYMGLVFGLNWNAVLAGLLTSVVILGISYVCTSAMGRLFLSFNPSE